MKELSVILLLALLVPAVAEEKEARSALVVGCDYAGSELQLPSPARDARDVASVLKAQLGFEVTVLTNPNRKQMIEEIDRFGLLLKKRGGVGLFYFSGHGAQNEGENYLFPVGARPESRKDLPQETVAAARIANRMEEAGNRVNLLFLDACRNNPLPSSSEKGALVKGLTEMQAARGMLISFATARDRVANDSGEGSLYTNALLKYIAAPSVSITDMLTYVNAEVSKISSGAQTPVMEVRLSDVFVLVPSGKAPSIPVPAIARAALSTPLPKTQAPTGHPPRELSANLGEEEENGRQFDGEVFQAKWSRVETMKNGEILVTVSFRNSSTDSIALALATHAPNLSHTFQTTAQKQADQVRQAVTELRAGGGARFQLADVTGLGFEEDPRYDNSLHNLSPKQPTTVTYRFRPPNGSGRGGPTGGWTLDSDIIVYSGSRGLGFTRDRTVGVHLEYPPAAK